jgi:hypothetical protein
VIQVCLDTATDSKKPLFFNSGFFVSVKILLDNDCYQPEGDIKNKIKRLNRRGAETQRKSPFLVNRAAGAVNNNKMFFSAPLR